MRMLFAALHESGPGTFETSTDVRYATAFGCNAEISQRLPDTHLVLNFRDASPPSPRGVLT
jgi:hypothetical protein